MIHWWQEVHSVGGAFDAALIEHPDKNDVHLHCLAFEPCLQMEERLVEWLSPDERQRAAAFRFASLQQRFLLSHAYARAVLAGYLGQSPRNVVFGEGTHGKPFIVMDDGVELLEFSLAHCESGIIVAIAVNGAVSVDIEQHRPKLDTHGIARRWFAPKEVKTLERLSCTSVDSHFLRLWTRKQAFLKATGEGLSYPIDSVIVCGLEDEQPVCHSVGSEYGPASIWSLTKWLPEPDCCVAVAVRRPDPLTMRIFALPESHPAQARRLNS